MLNFWPCFHFISVRTNFCQPVLLQELSYISAVSLSTNTKYQELCWPVHWYNNITCDGSIKPERNGWIFSLVCTMISLNLILTIHCHLSHFYVANLGHCYEFERSKKLEHQKVYLEWEIGLLHPAPVMKNQLMVVIHLLFWLWRLNPA